LASDLTHVPLYRQTIDRLEKLRHLGQSGQEYWMAREIHECLGYLVWDKFEPVISRTSDSLRSNGLEPSHHIAQTSKMMGLGKGGQREGVDYFLSRPACRLIAMNGDPSKPEIAAAQAYFVVQTHRMEQHDALSADEKRLHARDKVKVAFKAVSGVAREAGVPSQKQALFHDARSHGLYGMSARDVKTRKGLRPDDNLFEFAGAYELSANEFQMNMAANVIQKEAVRGADRVIQKNRAIAADVRKLMKENGSTMPEDLPVEEPIKDVRRRVGLEKKKALAAPKKNPIG
jgi:DNA-damage-inducible protein D